MCPQCRIVNNENFSRNRVLEDISRKLFPEVSGIVDATAEVSNEVAPMVVDVPGVRLPTYEDMEWI